MKYISLPLTIIHSHADWNLFFAFPSPFIIKRKNCISIIHDLSPFHFTSTMTLREIIRWKPMIKNAIKHNSMLLTVSETVRQEIIHTFKIDNVRCIYPGLRKFDSPLDNRILLQFRLTSDKYLLSVSTQGPRKNPVLLLKAFAKMCSEKQFDYKLVLTGYPGNEIQTVISGFSEEVKKKIIFTGWIKDEDLLVLYQNTRLFVLCSVYEGFGIPVIEAAQQGAPILLSDIPVFHEITHDRAVFFESNNPEDLCHKIDICLKNSTLGKIKKEDLADYTWDRYALKLKEVIKDLNQCFS